MDAGLKKTVFFGTLLFKQISLKFVNARQDQNYSQQVITQLLHKKQKSEINFKAASKESLKAIRRAKKSFF